MTADARSLPQGVGDTFDFDSQAGILFVLRAIRAADITSSEKNSLKDLVFVYNTGGKDAAVKKKLADTLDKLGVTPASVLLEVPKVSAQTAETSTAPITPGFMAGRLTPVFHPPTNQPEVVAPVKSAPAPVVMPISTPTPTPVAPVVTQSPQPVVAPVTAPVAAPVPVQKITPVAPTVRPVVPVPNPAPQPAPVTPVANNIEIAKKVEVETQPQPEATPAYVAARMERIRVIKSDVNARVGNPVNLVDVDNALGREYMSALLEAMKLLSSASEQESTIAMNRLETVYTKVQALLDSQQKVETPVAPLVSEVPVNIPPVQSQPVQPVVVAEVPVMPQPVVTQPAPEVIAPVSIPVVSQVINPVSPTFAEPTPTEANDIVIRSKVSDRPTEVAPVSNWESSQAQVIEQVQSVGAVVAPADVVTVARMSTPPAEPLRPVVSPVAPVYQPEVTPSVREVTPLRAITELPTADEVSAVEAMGSNPLYTKDVDAGLDQLLSEWAIFKKSGLFGTGPKGREHPLYIKIAPMQVPLILSGRFEGSSQEIKQSITDYMNGWRYEQGIIYEANETFDQYLRRVIRHIIDLQKTKRRS